MKSIHYKIATEENRGTKEEPKIKKILKPQIASPVSSENIELVKQIAYNGEYEIVDDGEPEPPPTTNERISVLEEQLAQSDETAIALYEAQEKQEVINAQQDEALMELYEMKY